MGISFKKPTIPEAAILASCKRLLTICKNKGQLDFVRLSTTGVPRVRNGRQFFTKNEAAGLPDLLIWLPNAKVLFVEVKSTIGRLSDVQEAFRARLEVFGHGVAVVRTVDDLEDALLANGVTQLWDGRLF